MSERTPFRASAPRFIWQVLGSPDRLYAIGTQRIRSLREIDENDVARAWLGELTKRELLLNSALHLSVLAGIGVTVLLLFGFGVAFMRYCHEPEPPHCSWAALCFLGALLFRLLQDIRLSQAEHDDRQLR
jgi:hypothetical protein